MKPILAGILFLAWTSAALAQAASNDALTRIHGAQRDTTLHTQVVAAEQATKREDWAVALPAWQRLANQGVDAAAGQLCQMYFDARQGKFEAAQATDWCRRAAGGGDAEGLYRIGLLYLVGLGVPKNLAQAQAYCIGALDKDGGVPAKFCLAAIALEQAHTAHATLADARNRGAEAMPADHPAAKSGASPLDMCDRAFAAAGVPFDATAVTKWCGAAAEDADPRALYRMGLMHLVGLGGAKDLDLADRDCSGANEHSHGHVPAAFCRAAVADARRSASGAGQALGLTSDQTIFGRALPNTLPDPFVTDRILDEARRTATGLDYTCRKMADWARFDAPGLAILAPGDKLFGKAILEYGRQDFDQLGRAADACAAAVAASAEPDRLRTDLDGFRTSMTELKARQAGLQTQRREARAAATQLAADQRQLAHVQQTLMGEVSVNASLGTSQEQACVETIRRQVTGSILGEQTAFDIAHSSRTDDNGNFVVRGEARIREMAGTWQQAREFSPFTCTFVGHTEKVASAILSAPPSGFKATQSSGSKDAP